MDLFGRLTADDHEQVVLCHDGATGLRAIVAIHSTRLGPALGGTRFHPYRSEEAALEDVLRLARAMTYKAAVAGLDLGGGKAVILGDPAVDKHEALLRTYGRFLGSLGGRYITAEDVGTTQADMDIIGQETRQVTGGSPSRGGSGDPSIATAHGVLHAMRATAAHLWDEPTLAGRHVAVAGVGKVGTFLSRLLVADGARVSAADVDHSALERAVRELGVEPVPVDKIHAIDCDLYSPCAMGGALNRRTIPELRAAAVVGAANNQLAEPEGDGLLADAGVLYIPDFVANAGGVINVAEELAGYSEERAYARIRAIGATTAGLLAEGTARGVTPATVATALAERRLASAGAASGPRTYPPPNAG